MFKYHEDGVMAVHRHREAQLMREAEMVRLARETQVSRPALYQQAMTKAGDWLIAAGTTLKGRVDPLPTSPEFGGGANGA